MNQWINIIISLLAAMMTVMGCGRQEMSRLERIESAIQAHPDSALAELRALDPASLRSGHARAKHSLLHSMALDKCYIDVTSDSIISTAARYYSRHGNADEKMKSLFYQGRIRFNAGDYDSAGLLYLRALKYSERTMDARYKGLILQHLSNAYNRTFNRTEALRYSELAYKHFKDAGIHDQELYSLHRLAEEYTNNGMWDKARLSFDTLLEEGVPETIRQDAYCGLACYYVISPEEDYNRAEGLYSQVLSEYGSLFNLNDWGCYAYTLAKLNRTEESDAIFSSLAAMNAPDKEVYYYTWKSMAERHQGKDGAAYDDLTKAYKHSDQIVRNALEQSVIKTQRDYFDIESQLASAKARTRLIALLLSVLCFITILFLATRVVVKRNRQLREEYERMCTVYESVKQNLHILSKDNDNAQSNLREVTVQLQSAESRLSQVRSDYINKNKTLFRELGRLCERYFQMDDQDSRETLLFGRITELIRDLSPSSDSCSELENYLNQMYDDVMIRFREDFPDLSVSDYKLVTYFFCGFDSVTIMILMGIVSKGAVYMRKTRIRKLISSSSSPYRDTYLGLLG